MAKKRIKLTESEFKTLVQETTSELLNEIGYRVAALPHGANYNAMRNKELNKDTNATRKMAASNRARIPVINQSINDNFPNLELHFIERDNANQYYPVVFIFNELRLFDEKRIVMNGSVSVSGEAARNGNIEFIFNNQSFYRVNYYGKGTIRRMYTLMIDNDYKSEFDSLLTFITNIYYSEKDNEHVVDINGPTLSKTH